MNTKKAVLVGAASLAVAGMVFLWRDSQTDERVSTQNIPRVQGEQSHGEAEASLPDGVCIVEEESSSCEE